MKKHTTLSPEEAVRLVTAEMHEAMAGVMDVENSKPEIVMCIRLAVLAGISSGVKLAAINEASAAEVATPLCMAVCAIANLICNPEVLN